jgi:hypothetical protein
MHTVDGTARMTLARMVRTCGADEGFWRAVAGVGWLEIDETVATVAVPGWDRRFSQAAKSRIQHKDRAAAQEETRGRLRGGAGGACAGAQGVPAPERRRGEEIREEIHHHPREAWDSFRAAWNAGKGRPWTPSAPPDGWADRISDPEWLDLATQAIGRLDKCRYFKTPMTLLQLVKPGWVQKVLDGQFDRTSEEMAAAGGGDKQPPREFKGPDKAAFEATRAKLARSLSTAGKE